MDSTDPKGYYAILCVETEADRATIKAAYRRRAWSYIRIEMLRSSSSAITYR